MAGRKFGQEANSREEEGGKVERERKGTAMHNELVFSIDERCKRAAKKRGP
jgi:hypothetical protein